MKIDIGGNIAKARKAKKITQQQLADMIGKSRFTIQKYELGQREPKIEVLSKISEILGTTKAKLIGEENLDKDFIDIIENNLRLENEDLKRQIREMTEDFKRLSKKWSE